MPRIYHATDIDPEFHASICLVCRELKIAQPRYGSLFTQSAGRSHTLLLRTALDICYGDVFVVKSISVRANAIRDKASRR